MKTLTRTRAFTIIELIVVVAIIAILTAIITANLTSAKAKGRDAKRVSDLAQLQFAMEIFFDRCNQYPTVSGNLPDIAAYNGCPSGITLGTFIPKIPTPPTTGESYYYGVNSSSIPTDYVLKAVLETNSNALVDVSHLNYSTMSPGVDCTAALAYCVIPR